MRVSQDRYERDLRRLELARCLIRHKVRTITIRAWTGFTEERIRNLARSYETAVAYASRRRGPPPSKVDVFLRFSILRSEAACLGGLARLLGVLPEEPLPNAAKSLPSVATGERLCQAYEVSRVVLPQSKLNMEQFILLVMALAEAGEIELDHCAHCASVIIVEVTKRERRICHACKQLEGDEGAARESEDDEEAQTTPSAGVQQPLF